MSRDSQLLNHFILFSHGLSQSRFLRPATLVTLVLLGLSGSMSLCQVQSKPYTQPQTTTPALIHDPTHPETQPPLEVDHDPIPSPDPDNNMPGTIVTGTIVTGTNLTGGAKSPLAPGAPPAPIQKRQDGVYTMHQDVDEVLLACAVVDERGRQITDLSRGDFRVWEDGVPQSTTSFLHQDQPVSLGILVDNSGSMRDKRAAVNAAALNLLRASNPQDSVFVVNFSDRAFLDQGFTSNIDALNRGLARFDSKGTTALYDAVAASADELANHGKLPKQVLLVISDGADNASRLDLVQAIHRVQNLGGPVVYTIGLLFGSNDEEAARAKEALERMSSETGGIAYFPHSLNEMNSIAAEVAQDIRDQYTIGYRSTKPASLGGYRVVHVEANAPRHGKLTVRTRRGYYANKPASPPTQTAQKALP